VSRTGRLTGVCYCCRVTVVRKLAAACAVLALLLACVVTDSQGAFAGDDGDDVAAACADLSAVLPAARVEPLVGVSPCGTIFVDERTPTGHAPELDIFRPPQARG